MKIIFAGTPEISAAVLQALINANQNIIACLTQPDRPQGRGLKITPSPVKEIAQRYDIQVLQPNSLKNSEIQQQLHNLQPDLMIVLAYGLILPQVVLDIPKLGCINIHASILPRWRGAAPIQHAILSGDKETGITIMQMDAGLDTGDILAKYPCVIEAHDTSADLLKKLTALAQTSILDALDKLTSNKLIPQQQNDKLATYAHKLTKEQAEINWHDSAQNIVRAIRAYNPWPVAFTHFMQETVRIWQASIALDLNYSTIHKPGTIVKKENDEIIVATGDGLVNLQILQFPGKKQLSAKDICHAHSEIKIGANFC